MGNKRKPSCNIGNIMKIKNKKSNLTKFLSIAIFTSSLFTSGCAQLNFLSEDTPKDESKSATEKTSAEDKLDEEI